MSIIAKKTKYLEKKIANILYISLKPS